MYNNNKKMLECKNMKDGTNTIAQEKEKINAFKIHEICDECHVLSSFRVSTFVSDRVSGFFVVILKFT